MSDAANGDFREFAAARLTPLYRFAILLTGHHQSAEDMVQETLARIYVVWGSRDLSDPIAYSRSTLMNVFLTSRRRRQGSREHLHALVPDSPVADADVPLRVDLQRALNQLKPVDRAIVVMRYLEDLPVEEVACALHLSPGNVRVRAQRARTQLERRLSLDQVTAAGEEPAS